MFMPSNVVSMQNAQTKSQVVNAVVVVAKENNHFSYAGIFRTLEIYQIAIHRSSYDVLIVFANHMCFTSTTWH